MCDPSAMAEQSLNFLVSNGQGTCYRVEIGHLVVRSAISGCHRPSLRWSAPNWAICSERHLIARGLIDYLSIVLFQKKKIELNFIFGKKGSPPPSPCCSFPSLSEGRDKRWMDARLRALHSAQCKWTHPEIFVFPAPFLPVRPSATLIRNNLGIRNGTRVYGDSGPDVQLPVHLLPCLFFAAAASLAVVPSLGRRIRGRRQFPLFAVVLSSERHQGRHYSSAGSLFPRIFVSHLKTGKVYPVEGEAGVCCASDRKLRPQWRNHGPSGFRFGPTSLCVCCGRLCCGRRSTRAKVRRL